MSVSDQLHVKSVSFKMFYITVFLLIFYITYFTTIYEIKINNYRHNLFTLLSSPCFQYKVWVSIPKTLITYVFNFNSNFQTLTTLSAVFVIRRYLFIYKFYKQTQFIYFTLTTLKYSLKFDQKSNALLKTSVSLLFWALLTTVYNRAEKCITVLITLFTHVL